MDAFAERVWTGPDGVRLHTRDYAGAAGEARLPVLCLHGLTRNARDFETLAPWIAARGRRVLAFDVRGRGGSAHTPDPKAYVVPTYVGDLIGWAGALGIGRALAVGTSMGGLITMGLAVAAPGLLAGAVLNDIGPVIGAAGLARIAGYVGGTAGVRDWAEAAAYARDVNGEAFPQYGPADWDAFARRLFRDQGGRPVLDYDPAIALAMRSPPADPAPDLWPLFDALAAAGPLLVVRGATSDILEPDVAAAMAARHPAATVVEIPARGHAPALDEPEALAAIARWLAEAA
jgi:pimeloyl-ACP methyl ester carboxylesterase